MDLALELDLHLNESARTVFTTLAYTLAAGYTAGTRNRTGRRSFHIYRQGYRRVFN